MDNYCSRIRQVMKTSVTLEKIIGEERLRNWKADKYYHDYVDMAANNVYGVFVGFALDSTTGMSFEESAYTRLGGFVTNTFFGRPYGKYFNWLTKKTGINSDSNFLKQVSLGIFSTSTFWIPVYSTMVAGSSFIAKREVDWSCVGYGALTIVLSSPVTGYASNWFYKKFRVFAGLDEIS